ncbi:hypothetical protein [Microvirga yunnanensis]|uniref:hypothetical protein n=1 Tax=Microvirga yunnanensis TaxID=2953740 RepID=UPI0021CACA11|nr:hypothetical protein [Microvirga sp. HBU67655]
MPARPKIALTNDEVLALYRELGTYEKAAAALGVVPTAVRKRVAKALRGHDTGMQVIGSEAGFTSENRKRPSAGPHYLPGSRPRSEAHWSDYSWDGWVRTEAADSSYEEDILDRKGEVVGVRTVTVLDPGVQYPAGWDGPKLADRRTFRVRQADGVKRTIVTGIQDRTPLHGPFMVNLEAFAAYMGASIAVVGDTYAKGWWTALFGNGRDKKQEPAIILDYPSYVGDRVQTQRLQASDVEVCAEVNIIPTAERPLSGLLTYGKGRCAVFSHPKQELESVPRAPHLDPVTVWTTGYATPPNYVQRKAGLKARFHHIIGAVLIEEDVDGTVFIYHLHADPETGAFQHFDVKVDRGQITTGHRVKAIPLGDGHIIHLDDEVDEATFRGLGSLVEVLDPEHVFVHDGLDFYSQNHHNRADPWHAAEVLRRGLTVAQEVRQVGQWLASIQRPGTTVHVVESNHDLALDRWLREGDWRKDPLNAPFYLEAALIKANAVARGESISIFETMVRNLSGDALADVHFLREDESFLVEGVQCGWHGHNGPNGSRGSTQGYLSLASKIAKGHDHTPAKRQGVASVGTMQTLMPKYAKGPTSWAHAHLVIYEGGRTSHVFIKNGKWRAEGRRAQERKAA